MGYNTRIPIIQEIERLRNSTVICYLTSLRPGVPSQIAEDQVRIFFDHLNALPARPVERLDIFLCSNGGNGTVPWRLVALFREFARSFNVLIPYRAYSAASLLALGADEIVMHPFAELGPIDPTVSNDYNPVEQGTGRKIGISVEDVRAYVSFIKDTVGITHEDELVQAIRALTDKVHPLALGNVERFVMQSRMIAKKILKTHMGNDADHKISEIVETMASKLYFHGHPINRSEAKHDLHLKVPDNLAPPLESAMWRLYLDFEKDFLNQEMFNPATMLANLPTPTAAQQMLTCEVELLHAQIECSRISSGYTTKRRYTKVPTPPGQVAIQEDILAQGWHHSLAPVPLPPAQL